MRLLLYYPNDDPSAPCYAFCLEDSKGKCKWYRTEVYLKDSRIAGTPCKGLDQRAGHKNCFSNRWEANRRMDEVPGWALWRVERIELASLEDLKAALIAMAL